MKCKGTHKDTIGLGCGTEQDKRKLGLGIGCGCYQDFLFNTKAGKERIERATLKAKKPRLELEKAKRQRRSRETLQSVLKSLKNTCHRYIRLRDKGKRCISCGTEWHKDFQAGHFYKAELFSSLRFNEYNIHGQCMQCNLRKEGNLNDYEINLPDRIGLKRFKELQSMAKEYKKTDFKWDLEELKKLRTHYNNKIKQLKQ